MNRRFDSGRLIWVFQNLSGILLIVFLGLHWYFAHTIFSGKVLTYGNVVSNLRHPLFFVLETTFLVIVSVHVFLGVRAILIDLGVSPQTRRWVNGSLFIAGIVTVGYGLKLTFALTRGG